MSRPHPLRPLSLSELNTAWTKVWRELDSLGFGCPRLETCQVYLGIIDAAYGYQWFGDRPEDRACGDIVLPRVALCHWLDYFNGRPKISALDILRHEYGHAYADVNRIRIETKRFEKAFGAPHDIENSRGFEYDPEYHITEYAATSTGEDFAEIFWKFLKHKGKLPSHHHTTPIIKKWEFVEALRKGGRL
jgi:hypothetical protein